ncbi:diguanylate cyclase [Vibrio penaeicida]|uniref:diguanylate cyclase n=1 Tax=Vibrio penaeicida TaxID=104609 RepID=UPI002734932E|nr:diguanylate cyclase [Vibrio penaeicida]MDP2571119.1 diguanylate cyclase [Vibrio penaeicida]
MLNRILVVEDSRAFRNYLNSQLKQIGFEVVLAESLEAANNIISQDTDFLCAVLDYCLPDGPDGEIIDLVLSHKIRAIVLTAQFNDSIREHVIAKGVLDYITKDSSASVSYLIPLLKRLMANHTHKALVVDDSITVRNHVVYLLEHQYIDTLQANDGQQAIDILAENPDITMIITDHDMPNKDGITMTREIRNQYDRNHLAILGLSGNNDRTMTARFLKAGANDFLYKPFNQEEFYCRVQHILDMKDATDELYRIANQDALTGLWNRRYLFNENNNKCCDNRNIAMIDIDFFKKVNDTYGHDGGDRALVTVAQIISIYFKNEIAVRFGGEEFCIQHCGDYQEFQSRLDNMRQRIEKTAVQYEDLQIHLTVSIGVSSGNEEQNLEKIIRDADDLLYQAKEEGRNRLVAR